MTVHPRGERRRRVSYQLRQNPGAHSVIPAVAPSANLNRFSKVLSFCVGIQRMEIVFWVPLLA